MAQQKKEKRYRLTDIVFMLDGNYQKVATALQLLKGNKPDYSHIEKIDKGLYRKVMARVNHGTKKKPFLAWKDGEAGRGNMSIGEFRLRKVCERMFQNHVPVYNDRSTLNGLEIDVFYPTLKLGFEFNGSQHYIYTPVFHSSKEDIQKQIQRDFTKNSLCKSKGIILITITETNEKRIRKIINEKLRVVSNREILTFRSETGWADRINTDPMSY